MADKQIIIDGVDVSGCPHYIHKDGSCSSHDCECVKCVHNVCFYKDYKAKEQECEELKKQYNCYACDTCKGKEDYINLKRHCENAIKSLHNKHAELDQLKTDREEALKQLEFVRTLNTVKEAEIRKLSKTLTEIKEIVYLLNDRTMVRKDICDRLDIILQKISECEGNDE